MAQSTKQDQLTIKRSLKDHNFLPITEAIAKDWYQKKYLSTAGYLMAIKEILCCPGQSLVIENIAKFCRKWGISRSAFYRGLSLINTNEDGEWSAPQGVILSTNPLPEIDSVINPDPTSGQSVPQANSSPTSETQCPTSGQSVPQAANLSHKRDTVSHERDSHIYIDHARGQTNQTIQTNTDPTDHPPNPPIATDGDGGLVSKEINKLNYQDSEGEDSAPQSGSLRDRLPVEPNTPTSTPSHGTNSREDQTSPPCSTNVNNSSHKQTVYERSLEHEQQQKRNYLAQEVRNWERLNSDQQATLKQITINGINRLEQPWRENGGQYTQKVREGVLKLKSWFDPARIPAHLSKQEGIIKNYRQNPCEAIEAYNTLLSYCNPETVKSEFPDQRHPCGFRIVTEEETAAMQKLLEEKFGIR